MQSRYGKTVGSGAGSGTGLHYSRTSGASTLSLYTNNTPNKRNTSSGYTSDHYTSPSSLHTLPGYVSDVCGSHVSKGSSYQSNPYGSSPGVKAYSAYGFSGSSMAHNLSSSKSRVPSITYSYTGGYTRNVASPSAPKYAAYNPRASASASTSQTTVSSTHFDSNNNKTNNKSNNEKIVTNKAPADFTSDSDDSDANDMEMRAHTNVIVTSRSTSPNRDISHQRVDSISATQQIIRAKKLVFGLSKKCIKQTQVSEQDIIDSANRLSVSPSPSRSLTPTYTPTPTLSPVHSPSHSPSPVRMRYGCTPNRRSNNGSNFNRYSMPIIQNTTTSTTNYSNYNSIIESNYSHNESTIPAQPLQPKETQTQSLRRDNNNFETMPAISEKKDDNENPDIIEPPDSHKDPVSSDQNNNTLLGATPSSPSNRRSIIRISPTAIRRRRSKSRNKLSGRSRSRSRERFLDREESSSTLTSSSDDEDHPKNGSDRHSRARKKKNINNEEIQYKGSLEGINELKNTTNDCIDSRSASAELHNTAVGGHRSSGRSSGSTNESSSPEKVILKRPSLSKSPEMIGPTVVVTRLPMKIKDPYSTETECEDNECVDESDYEKCVDESDIPVVTVRLTPTPDMSKPSVENTKKTKTSSSEVSSESSDNSCESVRPNTLKARDKDSSPESVIKDITDETDVMSSLTKNLLFITNCEAKSEHSVHDSDSHDNHDTRDDLSRNFRDKQISILSDFQQKASQQIDGSQEKHNYMPFPKEDNDLKLKNTQPKEVSAGSGLRDSGFSEASNRPDCDSPYDNLKPIDCLNDICQPIARTNTSIDSNESVCTQKQFISQVNDIDSLLTGLDAHRQTFAELERHFQPDRHVGHQQQQQQQHPDKDRDEARTSLSLFISKCQDIDEMIDPMGPTSPLSPNQALNFTNATAFCKIFDNIREEDDSVAVDACQVKVHNSEAMKSTVEAYTEEIDSSAVRIRENKPLSVHLSKITEEIEEDFNQNQIPVHRKYAKNTNKVRKKTYFQISIKSI